MIPEVTFAVPGPLDDGVLRQEVGDCRLHVFLVQDRLHRQLVQPGERMALTEVSDTCLVLQQE